MRMRSAVARIVRAAGLASALALTAVAGSAAAPSSSDAQPAQESLYRCAAGEPVAVATLGLDLCDAEPTTLLARRAEPDNLQTREGALVVEVEDDGIAAVAGVQPGDVIYRVAGVDVAGAEDAGAGLASVGTDSDTQINFLRRGRPYRIKLRR
ncbi:MAG: PDZ domain-containing protein [Acidobacteria bacterium]|nr:PDZ domain-containing protein [Acidobacteriota bacterium]